MLNRFNDNIVMLVAVPCTDTVC